MAVVGLDAKVVQDFADKLTKDLAASVNASGVNASGNLAKSFRYELQPDRLRVYSAKYYSAIEIGRKKTVNGGDGVLLGVIRRWIDQKGITPKLQLAVRLITNAIRSLKKSDKFLDTDNMHGLRVAWKAFYLYELGIRMPNSLDWLEITFTREL